MRNALCSFVANGVTGIEVEGGSDMQKVAIFLTGPKIYGIWQDLVASAKPAEKSYAQLTKLFADHFSPKPVLIAARFKFQQRNQQPSESISEYVAQLRTLTEHFRFEWPQLEDALRDRFAAGIHSLSIQRKLLSQVELTLEDAITIAQGMEAAEKQSETLCQAAVLTSSTTAAPVHVQVVAMKRKFTKPQNPCYRCGRAGHAPDRCYHREKVCNTCHKRGHIATACKLLAGANSQGDGVLYSIT